MNLARLAPVLLAVASACAVEPPPPPPPPAPPALVGALDARVVNRCNRTTAAALAAHGVDAGEVATVFYVPLIVGNNESARRVGEQAWVQLAVQPGSIVVEVDNGCGLRQVYARDGARLPR